MSAASTDAKRRVKLYALNASRQWDDKGTGHVTSCYHEPLDGMSLLVRNESDGSLLLESKIQLDTQYQKQQGTLIVWTESDNYDLALSFQEQDGCNEIWQKICAVQGRDPSYEQDNDEEQEEVRINLVDCDYDKLPMILEQIIAFSQTTRRRDVLASEYIENDYINKLLNIFRQADERQDLPTLHKLYEIFKQLFLYDRPTLTEVMLGESVLMDIIGVFEYEPTIQQEQPQEQQQGERSTQQNDDDEAGEEDDDDEEEVEEEEQKKDIQTEEVEKEGVKAENCLEQQPPADRLSPKLTPGEVESVSSKNNDVADEQSIEMKDDDVEKPKENQQQDQTVQNTDEQQQQPHDQNETEQLEQSEQQQQSQQQNQDQVESKHTNRKRHREFLKNGTTFKEVIPFSNQKLVDKIHQTFRVQYLQSSVLPTSSILEENAYASLANILFFNKVEIVSMIQENGEFLQNLFNQIISNETGQERKRELVLFLREYCIFSQTIQPKQRESFFKALASLKILSAVEVALSSNDQITKSAAIDIFTYLVEYSPHMTREHAVQQREGIIEPPNSNAQTANILKLVIEHITTDQDPELGTATQLSCIIKLLLDPENMPGDVLGKHSFLEFFYYTCMQSLIEPIKNATTPGGDIEPSANDRKTAQLLSIMLELLTFFMEHHYTQLRNYIISSDLLTRIISLIKSRHKFLVLSKCTTITLKFMIYVVVRILTIFSKLQVLSDFSVAYWPQKMTFILSS